MSGENHTIFNCAGRSYYSGRGDFFATYGVIRQWLMAEDQSVRAQADIEAWDEHNGGDFGPNGN